jgi:predicted lipoprotein
VRTVAPAIDKRVRERLTAVNSLIAKLGVPLERLVQTQPEQLLQARDAVKELEVSLKVDVASALGVTLTFQMGDGD